MEQVKTRVSKLLAQRGFCSRREADEFIKRGWVLVDGERVQELGVKAFPSQEISLDPLAQRSQARTATILLHKPLGYVSGQPEKGYRPAVELVRHDTQERGSGGSSLSPSHLKGLAPAGRLDIDSQGLLVFTQDGRVARQLVGEHSVIEKEYLVRVEGRLDAQGLHRLRFGLLLDGKPLKRATVDWINEGQLRFVLLEGRKRQIRRMCELVGLQVRGLKRVRIGGVRLGGLKEGRWRFLSPGERF